MTPLSLAFLLVHVVFVSAVLVGVSRHVDYLRRDNLRLVSALMAKDSEHVASAAIRTPVFDDAKDEQLYLAEKANARQRQEPDPGSRLIGL